MRSSLNDFNEVSSICERILDDGSKLANFNEENAEKVKSLISIMNTLTILKNQCNQLEEIINGESAEVLKSKYLPLGVYSLGTSVCLPITLKVCKFIEHELVREILLVLEENYVLSNSANKEKNFAEKLFQVDGSVIESKLKILGKKLLIIVEYFPLAVDNPPEDLFSFKANTGPWLVLDPTIKLEINLFKEGEREKAIGKLEGLINTAIASVDLSSNTQHDSLKNMTMYAGAAFYFFFQGRAKNRTLNFKSNVDPGKARKVWNMPDIGLIKKSMQLTIPFIKFTCKLYFPREYMPITSNLLLGENLNTVTPVILGIEGKPFDLTIREASSIKVRVLACDAIKFLTNPIPKSLFTKVGDAMEEGSKKISGYFENEIPLDKSTIIMHIHGGGFISMSSSSHQNYTRKWAKITGVPIFSVDYRLAPEFPYPSALDDVWQAYNFIINQLSSHCELQCKKIIVTGDSAGGNLAIGVTMLAIKYGIRVPDGLLASYPCLQLGSNRFTPSFLNVLQDPILSFDFLNICLDSYYREQGTHNDLNDPFLSPLIASDELLSKFPLTNIIVGDQDPFHDDCLRFVLRLKTLNVNAKVHVFNGMPHGFLSYDAPQGLPQAKVGVEYVGGLLKEMINSK